MSTQAVEIIKAPKTVFSPAFIERFPSQQIVPSMEGNCSRQIQSKHFNYKSIARVLCKIVEKSRQNKGLEINNVF